MIEKINDNIYRIVIPFEDIYTSAFLLVSGSEVAILDSGDSPEDAEAYIIPAIREMGLTVRYIVTTHNHSDHCGGRARLIAEYPDAVCVQFFGEGAWREGDALFSRFRLVAMQGHSPDGLAVYDTVTKTLLTGDAIQQRGVDKYRSGINDLAAYGRDIEKIRHMDVDIMVASHNYDPHGYIARGKAEIDACLDAHKP